MTNYSTIITSKAVAVARRVQAVVVGWLNSSRFMLFVYGLLLFQALWIALTARYPQAFDENFHLGLIQLHAAQWLPFFTSQPPGSEVYGPIIREPSYLFHYLMALPYIILREISDSLTVQVIGLRLVNIGLFVWGMAVARKLLLELGASKRAIHVVFFFFVITPIMPLLAGQINYDNLAFPVTGLLFLYLTRLLRQIMHERIVSLNLIALVLLLGMVGSLIKYAFTPILLGAVVAIAVVAWRTYRHDYTVVRHSLRFTKSAAAIIVVGLTIVVGGLFAERYAVNVVRYHSPVPDCAAVLTVEQCMEYSPWARDHKYTEIYPRPSNWGIFVYPGVWAHRMVFETMFTISSRFYPNSTKVEYRASAPLTIANYTAWTVVSVGFILCLLYARRIWRQTSLRILLCIVLFYTLVLFLKNFTMYLHTGEAVAIHGRYLIPLFPLLYYVLYLGFSYAIDHIRQPRLKSWLFIGVTLLMIQGGGLIVWIVRSDSEWFRQQSNISIQVNKAAQDVLEVLISK